MRDIYNRVFALAKSNTARDTYILLGGNVINAGLGFVFTWFVARAFSADEFGIFSAVNNMVYILIPLSDLGTTSGLIRFVAELESKGKHKEAKRYIKAAFVFKFLLYLVMAILIITFAQPISKHLLVSGDPVVTYWMLAIGVGMFLPSFVPAVLQAKKLFLRSAVIDVSYGLGRVLLILPLMIGGLSLIESFQAFALTGILSFVVIIFLHGFSFLKVSTSKKIYLKLISFSGWLGVNRLVSTIASRIDVQILAVMASASSVGYYALAVKLAFFISFLSASFSAVLAPRLASFGNRQAEANYLKKSVFALIPIVVAVIIWAIFARPFILAFGEQYLPAVNVFRVLALSMIPFLLTVPSVTAIIYSIKKPKYIGRFSILQLILVVFLNVVMIPLFDVYAPAIVFGIINTLLAIYSWVIVVSYYRKVL